MDSLLRIALINVASAGVLALAVAVASRWIRRPEIVHVLWVAVLLKLLMPPVLELALLPQLSGPLGVLEQAPVTTIGSVEPSVTTSLPLSVASGVPAGGAPFWLELAFGLWLAGAITLFVLALARAIRFDRALRRCGDEPAGALRIRAARLAGRLGLRWAPQLHVVGARISPMLWFTPGGLRLVVPQDLLARLTPAQCDTLLAHELAHVRRRDHWVRFFEQLVVVLFWWNPVVWWARSRLRQAEERSCDQWVLRTLPLSSNDYAEGLLKTVEFLSRSRTVVPALASGVGRIRNLETRLTMILNQRAQRTLSTPSRLVLALGITALLVIFPTWGGGELQQPEEREASEAHERGIRELERERATLEHELQELHSRRLDVERELAQRQARLEIERLGNEADALEALGEAEAAREIREQLKRYQRAITLEHEALELDRQRIDATSVLEYELRAAQLEAEELNSRGDPLAARDAAERAEMLERKLRQIHAEAAVRERRLQIEMLKSNIAEAELERARLVEAGRIDEATELEDQLRETERSERLEQAESRAREFEARLAELEERINDAKSAGEIDELERLRREYELQRAEIERELAGGSR
jgi:beta-lactamase regulating signal transducer with metallopeptidase domain